MAKATKMHRNVSGKNEHEGRVLDYPDFVHSVDSHGNIFCSLPDRDRIFPQYYTLEQLEDAWRWRETDLISEGDLRKLAREISRK